MTEQDVGKSTVAGAPWAKVATDIPRMTEEGLQERRRRNANKKVKGDVLVTGLNIFNAIWRIRHLQKQIFIYKVLFFNHQKECFQVKP